MRAPANPETFRNCAASTPVGGVCEADGELSTDIHLDNCDDYDFYQVAECHDESRFPVLEDNLSLASHEAFHCCCGSMLPPPPAPPPPPLVPAGGCDGWVHACHDESNKYHDLVRGLCPKTCGRCPGTSLGTFCINDEALLQNWKVYALDELEVVYREDLTCETAHKAELTDDSMIRQACA